MNNLLSLQTMAGKAAESTQEVAEYYASPTSVSPAPRASSEDIMIEPIIATPSSNSLSTYGSSNPISISHCTRGDPAPLGSTCSSLDRPYNIHPTPFSFLFLQHEGPHIQWVSYCLFSYELYYFSLFIFVVGFIHLQGTMNAHSLLEALSAASITPWQFIFWDCR